MIAWKDTKRGKILTKKIQERYRETEGFKRSHKKSLKKLKENGYYLYGNGSDWKAPNPYCFVAPIDNEDYNIFTANLENHKHLDLVGRIKYINEDLKSAGIEAGDTICFTPDSEYAFNIEGETLYRMRTQNICVKM